MPYPSVECTRALSASYNGNQRGPITHTANITLVVISVEPIARDGKSKEAGHSRSSGWPFSPFSLL